MKRSELLFNILLVPLDIIAIILAGIVAYNIRISTWMRDMRSIAADFDLVQIFPFVLGFSVLSAVAFAFAGLYNMHVTRTALRELHLIFVSVSTALLVVVLYFFFDREFFSRFIILFIWILGIMFVFFARLLIRSLQRFLSSHHGIGVHRLAVIGTQTQPGQAITEQIEQSRGHGYQIVTASEVFKKDKLEDMVKADKLDEVILCDPHNTGSQLQHIHQFCETHHLGFQYMPTVFETYPKIDMHTLAGVLLFRVKTTNLEGWGSVLKRIFDILFSLVFLIVFSPVYVIISILIKVDSQGPVLYKNERVGRHEEPFLLWKFRTMKQELCTSEDNPEALEYEQKLIEQQSVKEGPIYKIKDDPRVTRMGDILRKTSLDELPQFVNVLKGEMSIVGPRPHQPREVAQYKETHKKVLSIKPGITGLSQISGRSDLTFEEEVLYDTYYIEHWSFWSDIGIVLKTPFAMLMSREVD